MGAILTEGITLEPEKFTVPFWIPSENRKEFSAFDLELAAVFALSELGRAKGGGFFVKQPEEKTEFVSKIGYPLWLIPVSKSFLVFDGLNNNNYKIPYMVLANVKTFVEDLRRGVKTRETYMAFLRDHLNYFLDIQTLKEMNIAGLMADHDFLADFESSQQQATRISSKDAIDNMGLLSPVNDESAIIPHVQELETLYISLQNDVEDLNKCMKLLNSAARHYVKELCCKERAVREEFDSKLKAEEERVAPIVNDLKDEYNTRITGLTKHFDSQRAAIQKEFVKLEKEGERTEEKIKHYKEEANKQADKNNSAAEKKWKEKINQAKKQLSQIDNQLSEAEDGLKNVEERRGLEIFRLKDELETKTKEATKNLTEFEAALEAKLIIHKQEKEQIENETKQIINNIGKALKLREVDLNQFARLGVRLEHFSKVNTLFYVPFYVTCYQTKQQKRFTIFPPSKATASGLTGKLKRILGRAIIKDLMIPRFKAFSSLSDNIHLLIRQNAVFEAELGESGASANILNSSPALAEVTKGLAQLNNEGWLSNKEFAAINQTLT